MRRLAVPLLAVLPVAAEAQDLDAILAGFEEDAPLPETASAAPEPEVPSPFSVILSQRAVAHLGAQDAPHEGLSSLRAQVNLAWDGDLGGGWDAHFGAHGFYDPAFSLRGRENYTPEFLEAMESEFELDEAFVQGKLTPSLDLKLGRQIVVWGKSDAIRVTDILNPLDMREPGLTEIRDLRLPATMAKLDWYAGPWNLSAIAIPEVRFPKTPAFGSDFYPGAAPPPPEVSPSEGFGDPEYALALNGTFTGWDLSLYAARVWDDAPHGEMAGESLVRAHSRIVMAGASAALSRGNWLWKIEAAHFDGLEFLGAPGKEFSRLDVLVGFDYTGWSLGTVTLEAANRRIQNWDPAIAGGPEDARETEVEIALRYGTGFFNDRLAVNAVASMQGWRGENGGFQRVEATWEISDSAEVTFGAVNYVEGEKAYFRDIGDNDRFYTRLEMRF